MAQFDVYVNPNSRSRKLYPYILDVQNNLLADLSTKLVIPVGKLEDFKHELISKLTIEVTYNDEKLVLLTPQLASIPSKLLKEPIGSLQQLRMEIIDSIDFAITGV